MERGFESFAYLQTHNVLALLRSQKIVSLERSFSKAFLAFHKFVE